MKNSVGGGRAPAFPPGLADQAAREARLVYLFRLNPPGSANAELCERVRRYRERSAEWTTPPP
jgi:hypothetical protein